MELNQMLREQALTGFKAELAAAVTNGDVEAANKASDKIAQWTAATAPKAMAYGDKEVREELNKLDWFGVDPRKSGRAIALGKDMDPTKFASAALFTAALVKAVDEEFKPAGGAGKTETDEERETREAKEADDVEAAAAAKKGARRTDGPGESDAGQSGAARRTSAGPWTKLADAPADVRKQVQASADKFVQSNAPKEVREKFIATALETAYNIAQRAKGKK